MVLQMPTALLVVLFVILSLVLWLFVRHGLPTSSKTDEQLVSLFVLSTRQALEHQKNYGYQSAQSLWGRVAPYRAALLERGYSPSRVLAETDHSSSSGRPFNLEACKINEDIPESMLPLGLDEAIHSTISQQSTEVLTTFASIAYDEVIQRMRGAEYDPNVVHRVALVNVLHSRIKIVDSTIPLTDAMMNALQLETTPFQISDHAIGRQGIIDYVVWRDKPSEVDTTLLSDLANDARRKLDADGLSALAQSFSWWRLTSNAPIP